jgi:putative ABC transport system substrate-binding protein
VLLVGFLGSMTADSYRPYFDAFLHGLGDAGYTEGRNIRIESRWADGRYERLPALAAELVNRKVVLIVAAGGNPPAQAAKAATKTIPIVFVSGGDPVAGGLVTSFNSPGSNVTGVSWMATELVPKRLDLLRQLAGERAMIGALINPNYEGHAVQLRELGDAATKIAQDIKLVRASTAAEIERAFDWLVEQRVGALVVANDPFFTVRREQIVALTARHRLPTIYFTREFALIGGLMSYGASLTEAMRQGGAYAGKVLDGAKPGDLPVWQPARFELVINLHTARALGLTVPPTLLALADEVIE